MIAWLKYIESFDIFREKFLIKFYWIILYQKKWNYTGIVIDILQGYIISIDLIIWIGYDKLF